MKKFSNEAKAFTVIVVKIKDGLAEKVKNVILQPSKSPTNLFSCVAQYKDTDDTFIYIGLNTLENKMDADQYYLRGYSRPLATLVVPEMSREFFSDAEDFVWYNSKYFQDK